MNHRRARRKASVELVSVLGYQVNEVVNACRITVSAAAASLLIGAGVSVVSNGCGVISGSAGAIGPLVVSGIEAGSSGSGELPFP